jgi:hypothetical protein
MKIYRTHERTPQRSDNRSGLPRPKIHSSPVSECVAFHSTPRTPSKSMPMKVERGQGLQELRGWRQRRRWSGGEGARGDSVGGGTHGDGRDGRESPEIASEEAGDSVRGGARKDQRMDETRRWRIAWPPKAEVVSYGKLGRIFTRAKGHR